MTSFFALACNAIALFAQLAAATGGASWKSVGEVQASGRLTGSGLHGTAQLRDDLRGGRYARQFSLPVKGTSVEVYDGRTVWARDISGGIHPYDAWYPRARMVTEAYLTRRAYLHPNSGAGLTCAGFATNGTSRVALVRVEPRGGIAATLSIDTQSHLIDAIGIRAPITADVTSFADYRQVGRLVLPFSISYASAFEPENADRIEVTRYTVMRHVNAADFQKPQVRQNAHMFGRATSTTVPIFIEGRQLLIWASIDRHAPLPFILDTGGHAILDTVAARMLGLRGTGGGVSGGAGSGTIALQYTRVASVRIGDAELLDQHFLIIDYPYDFYERGRRAPLAGILGLEWLERYAARIDYGERTLTLTPLTSFSYHGRARGVPIRFQEDMPLARAAADGHAGTFGVDTGNAGTLILYGDFLRRTGLLTKYGNGYVAHGEGTGGANTGRVETLSTFAIGGQQIPKLAAYFTQMTTGSFSSWTEAGDLGTSVLSRFTPTFDYANQMLYLGRAAHPLVIAPNRSGLGFTKSQRNAIDVVGVRPNSAASALGVVAGDRILTANGKNAADLSSADFLDLVTAAPGTVLLLTIAHGTTTRNVRLTLR
jgi:hypothetical protein